MGQVQLRSVVAGSALAAFLSLASLGQLVSYC